MAFDEWTWVVDALAEELTALPDHDRLSIIASLVKRAGYQSAELELDGTQNARRDIVCRIVARLEGYIDADSYGSSPIGNPHVQSCS